MQSPSRIPSNSHHLRLLPRISFSDFSRFSHLPCPGSIRHENGSFRILSLSGGLKLCGPLSQQNFEEELEGEENLPIFETKLPVLVENGGKVSRYAWDGSRLELLAVDGETAPFCSDFGDGLRNLGRICASAVWDLLIPKQVDANYIEYVKWKFLHRVFSSALQVLATQAMFRAIGVGNARSLPSAAALNWVLKDGLGRLSRCVYTACVGSAFDTNLKKVDISLSSGLNGHNLLVSGDRGTRVRLATSLLFSVGIAVELMTPIFPHSFLLLASVANIAKQISLACHLATNPAVHRSFAVVNNLGEVSAKAQIQTMCFENMGLLLAALLNLLCNNNYRLQAMLPFLVFPFFSAMDLLGIYQSMKHVHLQTLTKDRLEIVLNTWIQSKHVLSPAEVSKREEINLFGNSGKELLPIRIGCVDVKRQMPLLTFLTMRMLTSKDFYFTCLEAHVGFSRARKGILVSLREGAGMMDAINGLLQACYVREALSKKNPKWEGFDEGREAASNTLGAEWFRVARESKLRAQGEMYELYEQMKRTGWIVDNILLSTRERVRYSFSDDGDG